MYVYNRFDPYLQNDVLNTLYLFQIDPKATQRRRDWKKDLIFEM